MTKTQWLLSLSIAAACAAPLPALADDHPYAEGEVVNIARIRTTNGHFEDYMQFLATTWKAYQEAALKAGYITGYRVLVVEARGENDPDILLEVRYKNWAALDNSTAKGDEIAKKVEGSVMASNESYGARDKIRRTLGSMTTQVLTLK
jgi:hypothetical protein